MTITIRENGYSFTVSEGNTIPPDWPTSFTVGFARCHAAIVTSEVPGRITWSTITLRKTDQACSEATR